MRRMQWHNNNSSSDDPAAIIRVATNYAGTGK
jgi:uncharacterized protein involved in type VI secretion and phage assembly